MVSTFQQKIRLKIPTLLAKTMQTNSSSDDDIDDHASNIDHTKDGNKWPKSRHLLPKKFGSFMSNIFGKGRSHIGYFSEVRRNDNNDHSRRNFTSESSKMQSFSSFFQNRAGISFIRGKTSETKKEVVGISDILLARDSRSGRKESEEKLLRVPSRILTTRHRLKMARSLRKMSSRRIGTKPEQNGDQGERQCFGKEEELCKKRILMGGKCRPLHHSGTLHYDKDGILLPDLIP